MLKKQIFSAVCAIGLCISFVPSAHALQNANSTVEFSSAAAVVSAPVPCGEEINVPTQQEARAAMTALKTDYPDGTPWTDDTPYSDGNYYRWKGGTLGGKNILAVGCVAFAFLLSDAAFGSLPARMYEAGNFSFSDVKVGDILRINGGAHTVIVLQVSSTGVVIAEGNNNGTVKWGRTLSRAETEAASQYITRYPENYVDPDDPSASEVVASGMAGTLSWTLTGAGVFTISGIGELPDYHAASDLPPWDSYADKILSIIVGEGITGIGSCAFQNTAALSVKLPDSLTTIGNQAFYQSSLISASIPSSVKTIGDDAFRDCPNLSSVSVSNGVETIGQRAFQGCQALSSIAFPASVTHVGAGAFTSCVELKRVSFTPRDGQVILGDNLFTQCWRLTEAVLPQSVDRIGEGMFQICSALSSLTIPQGAESIEPSAFASCYSLTSIAIPSSVTSIGISAFSNCSSLRDIYFEGNEEQWNRIGKSADVYMALANVTVHYHYSYPPVSDSTPLEIKSWGGNQVVFSSPLEEGLSILAARYNGGQMVQTNAGLIDGSAVSFNGMTVASDDVLFILRKNGLIPYTEKVVLK